MNEISNPSKPHKQTSSTLMNEMVKGLENYKKDFNQSRDKNKPDKESTKTVLYSSLDNLLKNISNLNDNGLKSKNIKTVYNWYKTTNDFHKSIGNITKRTSKEFYQIYPEMNLTSRSEYYAAKNHSSQFEYDHRTEQEYMPAKDR
jgi:hypothetical protein